MPRCFHHTLIRYGSASLCGMVPTLPPSLLIVCCMGSWAGKGGGVGEGVGDGEGVRSQGVVC